MNLPVVAEVGVVVSLLNVLAVEVTVVGVVVLSLMHTHRIRYFRQNHCAVLELQARHIIVCLHLQCFLFELR